MSLTQKRPSNSGNRPGLTVGSNRIGRGYPDVSANGNNIAIYLNGGLATVSGSSASTPIFASIINRINEERIAIGKKPVGFINPALYANPQMFNDITSGNNTGCNDGGFDAVDGWVSIGGGGGGSALLLFHARAGGRPILYADLCCPGPRDRTWNPGLHEDVGCVSRSSLGSPAQYLEGLSRR